MDPTGAVVLVIGSGMQQYREYLLSSAAARHPLWLFNAAEPTWQSDYVVGSTVLDLLDRDAVLAAARELANRRPVVGVLSWDEPLVVATAHVAAALGLPGAGVEGIEGCRDKHRNRRVLTEIGLPQPAYGWTMSEAGAVRLAERIGYPVVVKPRGMGASIGVVLAGSTDEVRAAFHIAAESSYDGAKSYQGGALVEEYLIGPEISVDAAISGGEYLPMFVARKQVGMFPYFEEIGHTIDPDDPLRSDPELLRVLHTAHRAIDMRDGITHTEVKLTKRGPVIVEINGRLGGDLIPLLGLLATGIDPGVTVVDVATGRRPELVAGLRRTVGVRFGYPPEDCQVRSVSVPEPDDESGLLRAAALVAPGTELRLPPGGYIARHSYVICTGDTPQDCVKRLDAAIDRVRLDWRAVEPLRARSPEGGHTNGRVGDPRQHQPTILERQVTHRDVELLAIGAGPSNLALAVALEELGPDDLTDHTLVIERDANIAWQRGMLLPEAQSQVSFLKDLVTLRNPQSRFSFINYLHSAGKLNDFVNMGTFWPYRFELSGYFQWVADSLARVRLEYSRECIAIEPRRGRDGGVTGWSVRLANGSTIACRYLVIGAGRDAHVPEEFGRLPADRIIHSTKYVPTIARMRRDRAYRVVVVGGAQSAAEMFVAVQRDLPKSRPTMIMRSIGLNSYETSKFINELYYPPFVDEFFNALPAARQQLLLEMHRTNYAGLTPDMLSLLYRQVHLDRLSGEGRLTMITMTDVAAAREVGDEVVLTLLDRKTGEKRELATDLVLLGTGFVRGMPRMVRGLGDALGLGRIEVTRHYRLKLDQPATAACYLQGVNEATHGIADSLLSVLAVRAHEIAEDIFTHRSISVDTPAHHDRPLEAVPAASAI